MGSFHRRTFLTAATAAALTPARVWADTPLLLTNQPLAFLHITVDGVPATALLDTGGVRGIQISGNLADTLHIELTDTGQTTQRYQNSGSPIRAGAADIGLDGRTFLNEPVSVAPGDIERIAEQIGHSFDAIIAWRFLSRVGFVADFARAQFSVGGETGRQRLEFDDAHGVPIAVGRLDGGDVRVLIDTGAPTCTIDRALAGSVSGDRVRKVLSLPNGTFEIDYRIRDLSALTRGTGATVVLGLDAMGGKRLALDATTRVMTLD